MKHTPSVSPLSAPPDGHEPDLRTRGIVYLALALLVLSLASAIGGGGVWFLRQMYLSLPSFDQFQSIEQPLTTQVLAADSSLIHEFSIERRFHVPLDRVPAELIAAVTAIEDRRFFSHWGLDIRRIVAAIMVDIVRGHYAQGASTLTQQLARNLFLTQRQSMIRKIREALTAVKLEMYYTKGEILELYLNQVYLGAGTYGVEAAAQRYFSKSIAECDLNELSTIAGIIQLPEHYRPDREANIPRITQRRNTVLRAMRTTGSITAAQLQTITHEDIPVNVRSESSRMAPYFVEMVRQEAARRFGDNALYNAGFTIYTTLDPRAQDSTERAIGAHLPLLQRRCNALFLDSSRAHTRLKIPRERFLKEFDSLYNERRSEYESLPDSVKLRIVQTSVVALDPSSGAIRVLVGGRDFNESKFNRAVQARRQPGSSIKPMVYAAAIEEGMTPASVVLDQPITLATPEGEWRPENYDRTFSGPVTIRHALARSINLVAIQVLEEIGADKVIALSRRLGLRNRMAPVPSLAIGACEATPMEMTAAYAAFANGGYLVRPYCIERIVSRDGRVIYEASVEREQVLSPQTAFIMADMMTDVIIRGTAASVRAEGFTRPAAGKTGTTNSYSDAWFVGFTPQIACGVWVGVDERRSMGHGVTGSRGAIPIWLPAMKTLHRELPVASFAVPEGVEHIRLCQTSNLKATRHCPATRIEYQTSASETDTCDVHSPGRRTRGSSPHDMFGTTRPPPRRPADEQGRRGRSLMF